MVFTKRGDFLTASARSVRGFDVYAALQNCSRYIEQFGGHKYAAGLSIKSDNYAAFKAAFDVEVASNLPPHLKTPEIHIDFELNLSKNYSENEPQIDEYKAEWFYYILKLLNELLLASPESFQKIAELYIGFNNNLPAAGGMRFVKCHC